MWLVLESIINEEGSLGRSIRASRLLPLVLLVVWIMAGCAGGYGQGGLDDPAQLRYLALGDSYTIGESVAEGDRWPVQLAGALESRGTGIVSVQILARTGWTTRDLLQAMDRQKLPGRYDLVSLQIGVNNQFQGRSQQEYREEFRELLERAVDLTGGDPSRVLVLSIPDYGVTPFGASRDTGRIQMEIDAFNSINQIESRDTGVLYVDITGVSRRAGEESGLTASDGLHPSAGMYSLWVEEMLPVLEESMENLEAPDQ